MKKIRNVAVLLLVILLILTGCSKKENNEPENDNNTVIDDDKEKEINTVSDNKFKNKSVVVDGRFAFDFPYSDDDFAAKKYEVGAKQINEASGDCYWVNEENENAVKTFRIEWTKEEEATELADYEKMMKDYKLNVEKKNIAGMDGFLGSGADPYYKGNYLAYFLLLDSEKSVAYWIYIESNDTTFLNSDMIKKFTDSIE